MLAEKGYYDSAKNPNGNRIKHQYESKTINNDKILVDHATDLTWQQSGSGDDMEYDKAEEYIRGLNQQELAGFIAIGAYRSLRKPCP
ncbi:MAG: hypothetical protein GWN00_27305 [Aliifodinibius sp.]|nr:DUF1566 domain-containing protein [Fodinibius sp.]NIV14532.1 hypothetical protein [Fodinibius sp.]NIY28374.1 hypothetical protein [Fodinibius sp.]